MTNDDLYKAEGEAVNIGLSDNQRGSVAGGLTKFVASTYVLYHKTLNYHWNVTGPRFVSIHSLLGEQYENLHTVGDDLAERVRALGYYVPGTMADFLKMSSIKEDESIPKTANDMLRNLLKDNETLSQEAKNIVRVSEQVSDDVTADIMTARMTYHDKTAWMLRSLLKEQ